MDPLPAGRRAAPPSLPWTSVGAGTPGGSLLVALGSPEESRLVASAFRRLSWRVDEGGLADVRVVGPDLVVTDAVSLLPTMAGDRPGSYVVEAWRSGADWVVALPFDPDDPLKTREFTEG